MGLICSQRTRLQCCATPLGRIPSQSHEGLPRPPRSRSTGLTGRVKNERIGHVDKPRRQKPRGQTVRQRDDSDTASRESDGRADSQTAHNPESLKPCKPELPETQISKAAVVPDETSSRSQTVTQDGQKNAWGKDRPVGPGKRRDPFPPESHDGRMPPL